MGLSGGERCCLIAWQSTAEDAHMCVTQAYCNYIRCRRGRRDGSRFGFSNRLFIIPSQTIILKPVAHTPGIRIYRVALCKKRHEALSLCLRNSLWNREQGYPKTTLKLRNKCFLPVHQVRHLKHNDRKQVPRSPGPRRPLVHIFYIPFPPSYVCLESPFLSLGRRVRRECHYNTIHTLEPSSPLKEAQRMPLGRKIVTLLSSLQPKKLVLYLLTPTPSPLMHTRATNSWTSLRSQGI